MAGDIYIFLFESYIIPLYGILLLRLLANEFDSAWAMYISIILTDILAGKIGFGFYLIYIKYTELIDIEGRMMFYTFYTLLEIISHGIPISFETS